MDFSSHLNDRLLFAVPKKGRLQQPALELLHGSDIQFHRHSRRDIALVKNLPIALIFLPAADIPTFVDKGRVDLGITGRDQVVEHESLTPYTEGSGVKEIMDLGFGRCKLQLQVPEDGTIERPEQLIGKTIATSFEHTATAYFAKIEGHIPVEGVTVVGKLKTNIVTVSGSVEATCQLGVADAVVDLVESGETMREAKLKPISTVVESSAVLIKSKRPSNPAFTELIETMISRIRGVLAAQRYILCTYNIEQANVGAACKLTPGKRSPTMTHLLDGWVAVQAMIEKKSAAVIMDQLEKIGAEDIIVMGMMNTRTKE